MYTTPDMKGRVVIVSPAHPYRGGQALVEAHLFETLTSLGYDCWTISYTLLYPSLFFPGTTQFDLSSKIHNEHASRITRMINSINPFSWIRAARRIRELSPSITIIVWWMPFFGPVLGTISYLARKWTGSQIVFLVENYVSHENRWFDHFVTRITLRLADHFIAESDYVSGKLSETFPGVQLHKTTLPVFNCFDYGKHDRESAKEFLGIKTENVVLFFGYIRPYKGLRHLILSFRHVLEKYPDTTLLIVGECYEDKEPYLKLLESEGLEEKSLFFDLYVPNEKVEPYFKAADLVCLPYRSASQSGIVMMSYGFRRPVVATRAGGLPEFVREGETGVTVESGKPESIAEGITRLLELRDTVDFGENIRRFTDELGHRNVERIMDLIAGSGGVREDGRT